MGVFKFSPRNKPDLHSRILIRHLREEDLPALEWGGEFSHFRRLYAEGFRRTNQGLTVMWVADMPDKGVIGQVFIQLICDRPELADGANNAYLYSFRIQEAYRNMGIGTLILDRIEQDLLERGYSNLTLNVAKENIKAQRLYQRHRFQIVAHEPGIWSYPDENGIWRQVNEPSWRMQKELKT
ncbi:MAG: GNAT family N-acetyltransferase [Anaerolineaceae bacterium]|nr:GNAT family N-acetyltransferase [Anaerolineaceae bacterium]